MVKLKLTYSLNSVRRFAVLVTFYLNKRCFFSYIGYIASAKSNAVTLHAMAALGGEEV
jgi:hypothetical protein